MNKILVPTVKKLTGNTEEDIANISKFMSNAAVCLDEIIRFAPSKTETVLIGTLKGQIEGLNITFKDLTTLYISGGCIEINGNLYSLNEQVELALGTVQTDTMYYIYVDMPLSGSELMSTRFSLETTPPLFDDDRGAFYKVGDSTKRYIGRYYNPA